MATIIIKRYKRENCVLDDMRTIRLGKKRLVSKLSKRGDLYLNKDAKIIKGRFVYNSGSNSYPILIAEDEVHIEYPGFVDPDSITTDQVVKQNIITVINQKPSGGVNNL